jgi:hypothetical protein
VLARKDTPALLSPLRQAGLCGFSACFATYEFGSIIGRDGSRAGEDRSRALKLLGFSSFHLGPG